MTRINLVPPSELADQHLFAEFREIKMVPKSLARSLRARGPVGVASTIPNQFTLNTGHVCFFYDKGLYLNIRFDQISLELINRGVNFDRNSLFDEDQIYDQNQFLYNDWTPTNAALSLIRDRIAEKIAMKPDWYKYYGNLYSAKDYV